MGGNFYPRPPGGGRPSPNPVSSLTVPISIHALRVEGDRRLHGFVAKLFDFYPRPPGGGRPIAQQIRDMYDQDFYPRPPGGGRLTYWITNELYRSISIHALRVEGDQGRAGFRWEFRISIHALRVEGDALYSGHIWRGRTISIHALRVEGDHLDHLLTLLIIP